MECYAFVYTHFIFDLFKLLKKYVKLFVLSTLLIDNIYNTLKGKITFL